MSAARPRPARAPRAACRAFAALAAVAALAASAPPARAQDAPPPADPWPLPTPAPTREADGARATIDALDARRQALAARRVADVLDEAVPVPDAATGLAGPGRTAVPPSVAVRGLKEAARRAEQAEGRTVPEMMQVLAAVAFDGAPVAHERPVVAGADRKIDRVFRGGFRPASVDDRPFVLQPSRLDRLRRLPAPPPPPPTGARPAAPPTAAELVVGGVRIDVDEALLRRALGAASPPAQLAALDAVEADLLSARDGDGAAARLARFSAGRKADVLGAFEGDGGLRRVSLRALLEAAGPDADATATCGGLTRLLGVACAPSGEDVTLVGVVEPGAPAVPLDALTLALREVWRDGRVPGCSLDPDPKNPAGPQSVRVLGVPEDSRFAKTMLDADYEMKRIVGRAPGAVAVEGVVDLFAALAEHGGELGVQRFWLTPVPPAPGDVVAAPEAAAALFQARVRVRTEAMQSASLGATGTGKGTAAAEACARSLTDRYDAVARAAPVFAELRALFDAVTCAQVLRVLAPRHPLLDRAAQRPYVRAEVPASYAGISVTQPVGGTLVTLMGGCDLDPRVTPRAFLDAPHPAFAALASASRGDALPGARPPPWSGAPERDDRLLAALVPQQQERWGEAADALSDVLADAPGDAEVLSLRAVARFEAGDVEGGILDAEEARALDPASPAREAVLRHLRLESGDAAALDGMRPAVAEALEGTYLATAVAAALERRHDRAARAAEAAVRVRPSSGPAHLVRGTVLWLAGRADAAAAAVAEGLARAPHPALHKVAGWVALQRGDARAAAEAFGRAASPRPDVEAVAMRSVARAVGGDVAGAVEDARAAVALDPTDYATGLAVQNLRAFAVYGPARATEIARGQLMLPPDVQMAAYEGLRAQQTGDAPGAIAAISRAIETLASSGVSPAQRSAALADETYSFLLARAYMDVAASDPSASERIEGLAASLERMHPGWVSPRWLRATAALKRGDARAAIAGFSDCRGLDPADDRLLAQALPADRRGLEQVLAILETSAVLQLPADEGPAAMKTALARLSASFQGTRSAPAAEGVRVLFEAMEADASPDDAALFARVGALAAALPPPGTPVPPGEAMVQAMFLGMHAATEADRPGGDPAPALRALASLTPTPDVYDTVTNIVVGSRQQAVSAVLARLLLPIGVVGRGIEEAAAADPDGAAGWVRRVFGPIRAEADALGDPVVAWMVREAEQEAVEGAHAAGTALRLSRVEAVLAVATDPAKVARLEAARATLVAARGDHEARARARLAADRRSFVASRASVADVRLLGALVRGAGASAPSGAERAAELAPGIDDARRVAELTVAACARALGVGATGGGR